MKSTLMMGTLMKSTLMKSAPMKGTSMDTPPTAISRPLPRLALAALVLALGACATQSGDAVAPQAAPAEAGDAATSPGVPDAGDVAMHCDATAAQPFVGRHATQTTLAEAQAAAGATGTLRVIEPGQPVTMDFRADRLNVEVDDGNAIVRITCG